jgi:hypothetical protein
MMMSVEQLAEWEWTDEVEVFEEYLLEYRVSY